MTVLEDEEYDIEAALALIVAELEAYLSSLTADDNGGAEPVPAA